MFRLFDSNIKAKFRGGGKRQIMCCLGVGTVPVRRYPIRISVLSTALTIKLMYVYEHKLRNGYVSGTDTSMYLVPVLSLKWSTHALYGKLK
jgi:hypothetical protein